MLALWWSVRSRDEARGLERRDVYRAEQRALVALGMGVRGLRVRRGVEAWDGDACAGRAYARRRARSREDGSGEGEGEGARRQAREGTRRAASERHRHAESTRRSEGESRRSARGHRDSSGPRSWCELAKLLAALRRERNTRAVCALERAEARDPRVVAQAAQGTVVRSDCGHRAEARAPVDACELQRRARSRALRRARVRTARREAIRPAR